jgi:histidyl-tRNA synthetase
VLVVAVDPTDQPEAVRVASELRRLEGIVVEQDVRLRGVKAALRYADRAGINAVVILGAREREEGRAVLRDMRARSESSVERAALADTVRRLSTQ